MKRHPEITETELLILVAKGDREALEILFRNYWDQVYSLALLMTKSPEVAGDISQEVFFNVFNGQINLREIKNLKAYLLGVAKYKVLNWMRRRHVETAYQQYMAARIQYSDQSPEAGLNRKELQSILLEAVAKLPKQQRTAFELSRIQGLTHEQISSVMGVSKQTVKDYIVRAIALLRKIIQRHGYRLIAAAILIS